jgi:hypothetical protein
LIALFALIAQAHIRHETEDGEVALLLFEQLKGEFDRQTLALVVDVVDGTLLLHPKVDLLHGRAAQHIATHHTHTQQQAKSSDRYRLPSKKARSVVKE